jgi:hypothetical protein
MTASSMSLVHLTSSVSYSASMTLNEHAFRCLHFLSTLLDVGHLDFLEKARKQGDYLIVGIHTDPVSFAIFSWFSLLMLVPPGCESLQRIQHAHHEPSWTRSQCTYQSSQFFISVPIFFIEYLFL